MSSQCLLYCVRLLLAGLRTWCHTYRSRSSWISLIAVDMGSTSISNGTHTEATMHRVESIVYLLIPVPSRPSPFISSSTDGAEMVQLCICSNGVSTSQKERKEKKRPKLCLHWQRPMQRIRNLLSSTFTTTIRTVCPWTDKIVRIGRYYCYVTEGTEGPFSIHSTLFLYAFHSSFTPTTHSWRALLCINTDTIPHSLRLCVNIFQFVPHLCLLFSHDQPAQLSPTTLPPRCVLDLSPPWLWPLSRLSALPRSAITS